VLRARGPAEREHLDKACALLGQGKEGELEDGQERAHVLVEHLQERRGLQSLAKVQVCDYVEEVLPVSAHN
jgi:hypothetical protein